MTVKSTDLQATVQSLTMGQMAHKPRVEVGQPFDRDTIRWYPVTITDGNEVVNIEAPFTRPKSCDNDPSEVQVVDLKEIKDGMAIGLVGSDQFIIRVPFDGENRRTPASFPELKELVLKTTQDLGQNFMESDVKELTITNLFACQVFLNPEVEKTVEIVDGKSVITRSRPGSCIRIYSTQQALYYLIDRTYTGVLTAHTEAFVSSFKVTRLQSV
jgi:hypothetical protein